MRILGVDPGLTRCGVGVIETAPGRKVSLVSVEVVRSMPETVLEQRLRQIGARVAEIIDLAQPDAVAIERVFMRSDSTTVMSTAHLSGVVMFLAAERNIPVSMHTPSEVKAAVTGYGNADKAQVGTMVAKVLGLAEVPKPADAADSLALAICHAWRSTQSAQPGGRAALTPAQEVWRAAEREASSRRSLKQ